MAREAFISFFPEVFDALFKLCADTEPNVQNATSFLDNLVKARPRFWNLDTAPIHTMERSTAHVAKFEQSILEYHLNVLNIIEQKKGRAKFTALKVLKEHYLVRMFYEC